MSKPKTPPPMSNGTTFCRFHFGNANTCNHGTKCNFSHDKGAYQAAYDLAECACGRFMKSTSQKCKECRVLFCRAYFGPDARCDNPNCGFSHDENWYMEDNGLARCTCGNFMKNTSRCCRNCRPPPFCRVQFGEAGSVPTNCEDDLCTDEHSEPKYMQYYNLKLCSNCSSYCKKDPCMKCRPMTECASNNCTEQTKFKFCKQCKDAMNEYLIH